MLPVKLTNPKYARNTSKIKYPLTGLKQARRGQSITPALLCLNMNTFQKPIHNTVQVYSMTCASRRRKLTMAGGYMGADHIPGLYLAIVTPAFILIPQNPVQDLACRCNRHLRLCNKIYRFWTLVTGNFSFTVIYNLRCQVITGFKAFV